MLQLIMNTIPPCMDRYVNRYIVPPPQQPQGYYQHQQAPQQHPQPSASPQLSAPPPPSHPHNYMIGCYPNANGWTGVPLISTASRRPRKYSNNGVNGHHDLNRSLSLNAADFDEHSITRLALHAHGAPLIFSGRYRCKNNNALNKKDHKLVTNNNNSSIANNNHLSKEEFVKSNGYSQPTSTVAADANSTTSEENSTTSGSSNSSIANSPDTCLPRIIKPRKRRKKDRKPQPSQENVTAPTTSVASTVVTSATLANVSKINICSNKSNSSSHDPMISNQYCSDVDAGTTPIQFQVQFQHFTSQPEAVEATTPNDTPLSSCSCRLCDPFCKIWAFPLRRSCSDNSTETVEIGSSRGSVGSSSASSSNSSINRNVGVIGSNRSASVRNEWKSTPKSLDIMVDYNVSRKGSFSDSGDSGCDLLSGIHFSEDILTSVGKDMFLTPTDSKEFQFPANNGGGGGGVPNTVCLSESSIFNESINELSRKLSESLEIKSDSVSSSDSGSVFSDSVFSDGVPDLFMSFDSISRNVLFSAGNISKLSSLLFDDNLTPTSAPTSSACVQTLPQSLNNNNNNNNSSNSNSCQSMSQMSNCVNNNSSSNVNNNVNSLFNEATPQKPFIFVPDKDRGTEILNCFDMVWNPQKLLPVEE